MEWPLEKEGKRRKLHQKRGKSRDEDTVGFVDFWPTGSGSETFFIGSGSYLSQQIYEITFIMNKIYARINIFKLKMMVYKIECYAYLPNIQVYFFPLQIRSDPEPDSNFSPAEPDPRKKVVDPHPCLLRPSGPRLQVEKCPVVFSGLFFVFILALPQKLWT